ncbi:SDR family NAD(P)-dependent oxidoreductase [Nocardioides sp. Iso805N]|uniref:SDR family NAD(P)-dependent oxidoreductase n=1 Tax=Nocardioides sp. Iso805N TaxID=1283287 RepID=UPI000363221C|nr:SDR family NAD(P)-dependent oxidoreductase [Nocardioides sp. Iso805N]
MTFTDKESHMLLNAKRAVVTGAGAGIGRAISLSLAEEGARVLVSDLDEGAATRTAELITAAGGTASATVCDVADEASVVALFDHAARVLGGIDLAVNNAGIADHPGDIVDLDVETWDRVVSVDLRGTFLCLREELRRMSGSGSIVNIASNAGLKNAPGMAAYTAAKHGVVGLTKNVALQYARRGIRVNAVCPGTVGTEGIRSFPAELQQQWSDMIPMGRIASPEEVARSVVFLLSDQAAFVTGVPLLVDGGLMYD